MSSEIRITCQPLAYGQRDLTVELSFSLIEQGKVSSRLLVASPRAGEEYDLLLLDEILRTVLDSG